MDQQHDDLIIRIAHLTRILRENIRDLGLDRAVVDAAQAIPDARDRLRYVAQMTEQAATTVLNATEEAQPLQHALSARAKALLQNEQAELQTSASDVMTTFLVQTVGAADRTGQLLQDIMMAQGFQDLTGQVVMKLIDMIGTLEKELLQVLVDYVPEGGNRRDTEGLLNGPQVTVGRPDVVTGQDQVDDLLESLGF